MVIIMKKINKVYSVWNCRFIDLQEKLFEKATFYPVSNKDVNGGTSQGMQKDKSVQ